MKIKNQLLLALGALLFIFIVGVGYYAQMATQSINERWAQRLIDKQLFFDKNRTLRPILQEIALAGQMAQEPAILKMALNDNDLQARQAGLDVLESYRLQFQDHSYFAAFTNTQHYFYNDIQNAHQDKQLIYTLNAKLPDDQWFFKILQLKDQTFQININKDTVLGSTKIWFNILLKHQGDIIGVLGTGFELDAFLKQTVDIQEPGIRNLFTNDQLAIQLDRDSRFIQHASFTKPLAEQENIAELLQSPVDIAMLKSIIQELKNTPNDLKVKTFWSDSTQNASLIGVSYLPEINWFNITIFDSKELIIIDAWHIALSLSGLFLLVLLILFRVNHTLFLQPLHELTQSIQTIRKGDYNAQIPIATGHAHEIDVLSSEFKELIQQVKFTQDALEHKVTERTRELFENQQKLNTILDAIQAFIFIKDTQYNYVYANKTLLTFFKVKPQDIIGQPDSAFLPLDICDDIRENDTKVIELGQEVNEDEVITDDQDNIILAYTTLKVPLRDANGKIYALCGISWNTIKQKRAEKEIQRQALYDNLTQLPNRRLLNDRLKLALSNTSRKQTFGALLFVDLDNFKPLNDSHGHDFGDLLLIEMAQRLKKSVRETDTVARFGGDEFIILLSELSSEFAEANRAIQQFSDKLLTTLNEPYHLSSNGKQVTHQCSASIGIRLFKGHVYDAEQILHHADQAMYMAKKQGKNQYHFSPFSNL